MTYYGFQDMVFGTWDLNFGALEILGYGFRDLGSQLWGLGNFRIWFSGLGISTLGPGFSHKGFRVAFGHGHPLVCTMSTLHHIGVLFIIKLQL
jgi:hypothetical protein